MLVEIENLKIAFQTRTSRFEAVRGVSMKLGTEKLGIVGESGSGKSLTARALMKLLPSNADIRADKLAFDGIDVLSASERQMRQIRGKRAGFILQDPKYSLNPVKTIGAQVAEAWRTHKGGSKRAAMEAAIALLDQVKIRNPRQVASSYAHEVSGGMGQRVMIAMMLAPDPELLIADEPTSALDATVQAEILRLIEELVSERGMGLILISHDLPLVSHFCGCGRRYGGSCCGDVFRPGDGGAEGFRASESPASLYAGTFELHSLADASARASSRSQP